MSPVPLPKKLSTSSPSFRLRNSSLNALRLRRVFDMFDRNHDGIITVEELAQSLSLLGISSTPEEISVLIPKHLMGLDFPAFEELHKSLGDALFGEEEMEDGDQESQEESDMVEAFKVFDEDGDGYISAEELQVVLGKLGMEEGENLQEVMVMIGSADNDKNGKVDFVEFKNMMRSVVVQA